MNPTPKALRRVFILAALAFFTAFSHADPAPTQAGAAPAPTVTPKPETPLHEIGAPAAPAPVAEAPAPAPVQKTQPGSWHVDEGDNGNDRVSVSGSTYVGPDETVQGNAVAVMGPVTVDGTVNGNAVSVLGTNKINGTVHGNAVVVMGTLRVGRNAHIDGNAVAVAGRVIKEPGAFIGGNTVEQAHGVDFSEDSAALSWWNHGLSMGRPLAFGPHLHLFWVFTFCLIAIYLLLALVFPTGIVRCGETLAHRPGITLLTGFLTLLGLPVLFVLLLVTIVGIPVAIVVLPLLILAATTFGKAAIYALIGHSIVGKQVRPVAATLVGVIIIVALDLVPILGIAIWMVVGFLGFSCAVTALFTSMRAGQPAAPVPPPAAPPAPPAAAPMPPALAPVAPVVAPGMAAGDPPLPPIVAAAPLSVPAAAVAPASGGVPPVAPQAAAPAPAAPVPPSAAAPSGVSVHSGLPRAGFWIRMLALLLDIVLVAVVTSGLEHETVHHIHNGMTIDGGNLFPLAIAVYGAILWKLKGSTVGGIICGLSVVRTDDRPMDWTTSIVRALACFFSLIALGLGFIWIGIDPQKQAWHDKIAGTLVVRHPKGVSLV